MAQPPLKADGLEIEQDVLLTKDSGTGGLLLKDNVLTSGILLQALASLRAVEGVYLVGRGGDGAEYSTLQAAVDAVPASSSPAAPNLILMLPGVYVENVIIEKDGIEVVALGRVLLQAAAGTPTITIQEGATIPTRCVLQGLHILNTFGGASCVSVIGGAASTVASDGVYIQQCNLDAQGVGTRHILGDTVNNLIVEGGSWTGSVSALTLINQCALFVLKGLREGGILQTTYNNILSAPATATSEYRVEDSRLGDVVSTLAGVGSLAFSNCSQIGDVTLSGDRPVTFQSCSLGDLIVNAGTTVKTAATTRGTAAGSGTLDEPVLRGSVAFAAEASKAVTFDVPMSDSEYTLSLDKDIDARTTVPSRSNTGFTIEFPAGAQTGAVSWAAHRKPTL